MDPEKSETIIALQGSFGLVLFDTLGAVVSRDLIAGDGPAPGFDIPYGTFHTLVALESGSVFFEAKAGPYLPPGAAEVAAWAPAEGTPDAQAY
jgi:cupin fold WbuC family metalloprotein